MSLTLQQLAEALKLEFRGNSALEILDVASLQSATKSDLCFIQHKKYLEDLAASQCSAVLLPGELAAQVSDKAVLVSENPQYHFVKAIELLRPQTLTSGDNAIHPSAQVSTKARIAADVSIGNRRRCRNRSWKFDSRKFGDRKGGNNW